MSGNEDPIDLCDVYLDDETAQKTVNALLDQAWDEDAKSKVAEAIYDGYSWGWRAINTFSFVEDERQAHFQDAQEVFAAVKAEFDISSLTARRTDDLSAQEVIEFMERGVHTLQKSGDENIKLVLQKAGITAEAAWAFVNAEAVKQQQQQQARAEEQAAAGEDVPMVSHENFQNYLEQQFVNAINNEGNHEALAEHVIQLAKNGKLKGIVDEEELGTLKELNLDGALSQVFDTKAMVIDALSENRQLIAEHMTNEVFGGNMLIPQAKIADDNDVYELLPTGIIGKPTSDDFKGKTYAAPQPTTPAREQPVQASSQPQPAQPATETGQSAETGSQPGTPPTDEAASAPATANTVTMDDVNAMTLNADQVQALIGKAVNVVASTHTYDGAMEAYYNANKAAIAAFLGVEANTLENVTYDDINHQLTGVAPQIAEFVISQQFPNGIPEGGITTSQALAAIKTEFGEEITIPDPQIAAAVTPPGTTLVDAAGQTVETPLAPETETYRYQPPATLPQFSEFSVPISFEYETDPLHTAQLELLGGRSSNNEEMQLSAEQAEALASKLFLQASDENSERRKMRREAKDRLKALEEGDQSELESIGQQLGSWKEAENKSALAVNYFRQQLQGQLPEEGTMAVEEVVALVNSTLPEGVEVKANQSTVMHVIRTNPILETVLGEFTEVASGRMIAKSYLEAQTAMLGNDKEGYMHVPLMHSGIENDQLQQFLKANPALDQVTRLVEQNLEQLFQSEYAPQILAALQASYPEKIGNISDPKQLLYGISDVADTFMTNALTHLDGKPLTAYNLQELFENALKTQVLPNMTFENKQQAQTAETRLMELVSVTEAELRDVGFGKTSDQGIADLSRGFEDEQDQKKQDGIASYVANFINSLENPSPILQLIATFIPQILALLDDKLPGVFAKVENLVTPNDDGPEVNPVLEARGDKPEITLAAAEVDGPASPSNTPAVQSEEGQGASKSASVIG